MLPPWVSRVKNIFKACSCADGKLSVLSTICSARKMYSVSISKTHIMVKDVLNQWSGSNLCDLHLAFCIWHTWRRQMEELEKKSKTVNLWSGFNSVPYSLKLLKRDVTVTDQLTGTAWLLTSVPGQQFHLDVHLSSDRFFLRGSRSGAPCSEQSCSLRHPQSPWYLPGLLSLCPWCLWLTTSPKIRGTTLSVQVIHYQTQWEMTFAYPSSQFALHTYSVTH